MYICQSAWWTLSAQQSMSRRSYSFANDACAGLARPKIAFLLSGNIRSFTDVRVYKSIRHHLVDGLGGNATLFIHGKRASERWARGIDDYMPSDGTDEGDDELRAAIGYLSAHGGPPVLAEFVAATGSIYAL